MFGDDTFSNSIIIGDNRGIVPRSLERIFSDISILKNNGWESEITVEFLEIYNENIRDLLVFQDNHKHEIRQNQESETIVTNLTRRIIYIFLIIF